MAETADTVYESVIHALKHEPDITKLCGKLYNLTTLYYNEDNWPHLERHEAAYAEALAKCEVLAQEPEKTPTIQPGEKVDFSGLIPVHELEDDNGERFDKHVMVLLRHLA